MRGIDEAGQLPLGDAAARLQLRNEIGTFEEVVRDLAARLRERNRVITGRDRDLTPAAAHLARQVFDRWAEAGGVVPVWRRELSPRSWTLPFEPEAFVEAWNERPSLRKGTGRGQVTRDALLHGSLMSGGEFLDWNVDGWAGALEHELSFGWFDVVVPIFASFLIGGSVAAAAGLPAWASILAWFVPLAPVMLGWRKLRRHGYIGRPGDD